MHRQPLKELLAAYQTRYPNDAAAQPFIRFVDTQPACFDRSLTIGHVTGSAWIVDPACNKVLLVHHKKLGLWLQPGGHCDGDADVAHVAEKETREETGLETFHIFKNEIFDLDIHQIPRWKDIPEHLHYDVRFLIHADSTQSIQVSDESNDLKWFRLDQVATAGSDHSVIRMAKKAMGTKTL